MVKVNKEARTTWSRPGHGENMRRFRVKQVSYGTGVELHREKG